ncbi:MAG: histidine triad nucleotide-binding protein [Eubacteriales bacterium]|nr:histidine triad nucleotide-binding protein [Eubacteriales bacterium]
MKDCLFCKIIAGEIPSKKVYEDEDTYAFYDINPQAPVHVLVVSKKHTPDVAHNGEMNDHELAACLRTCAKVADQLGVAKDGFRIVNNCGDNACQSVKHLHFHVLGGEKLSERMA